VKIINIFKGGETFYLKHLPKEYFNVTLKEE